MPVWIEVVWPAIEIIVPHLRPCALVVCDNTRQFEDGYRDYFAFVRDPARGSPHGSAAVRGGRLSAARDGESLEEEGEE
jgi:hypothetical protein